MSLRKWFDEAIRRLYLLSCFGMQKRWLFSRQAMYAQIEEFSLTLPDRAGRVLSISHSNTLLGVLGIKADEYVEANYPDENILRLPFPDNSFDWVISDQVFEHIVGCPQTAMRETIRVLKPGGQLLHTTCFMTAYHGSDDGSLEDFWRFSPQGLAFLCRDASATYAQGSGHPIPNLLCSFGLAFEPAPVASWHPINWVLRLKSRGHASQVWVYAKK